MYFEEKMIDGIMCYRTSPDGEFVPYDIKNLSRRYMDERDKAAQFNEKIQTLTLLPSAAQVRAKIASALRSAGWVAAADLIETDSNPTAQAGEPQG